MIREFHVTIIVAIHDITATILKKIYIFLTQKMRKILNIYRYIKKTLNSEKKTMTIKQTVITSPYNFYWIMFTEDTSW